MRDNLAEQVELAVRRRAVKLPNALPPSTLFDPRLPGFTMPAQSALNIPRSGSTLPEADEDIAFAPVRHLSSWIAGGQLSSVRLTRIYLDRIRRHDPALFSFATVTDSVAMAQAERADALLAAGTWLGPLHGIPYGAKDILDTAGITTGWGAEPFAHRVPETDAEVIRRLTAAGAVLLGKTSVGALAYGEVWYGGRTRNPWNTEEGSRGSSAGSASATAAGLVGFAIGTETLGSIVAPCARCGAVGLRPTFGRVSRAGAMALCWSLDKIGPICRAVDDAALVLAVINGFDAQDAWQHSGTLRLGRDAFCGRPARGLPRRRLHRRARPCRAGGSASAGRGGDPARTAGPAIRGAATSAVRRSSRRVRGTDAGGHRRYAHPPGPWRLAQQLPQGSLPVGGRPHPARSPPPPGDAGDGCAVQTRRRAAGAGDNGADDGDRQHDRPSRA